MRSSRSSPGGRSATANGASVAPAQMVPGLGPDHHRQSLVVVVGEQQHAEAAAFRLGPVDRDPHLERVAFRCGERASLEAWPVEAPRRAGSPGHGAADSSSRSGSMRRVPVVVQAQLARAATAPLFRSTVGSAVHSQAHITRRPSGGEHALRREEVAVHRFGERLVGASASSCVRESAARTAPPAHPSRRGSSGSRSGG